ncbi:hypothetical protein [Hymenobacter sp. BT559]|jgi:hypothetical protein|uniref:hypothetical protein n=1 Tax=Hymenobacter sp. BT559 TaxID=2795729 RepID=UPI0018EAA561|nr:hypothetical protein [Hymenobacter sp. BT559]MBJ6144832.1 hypothetical protein [Hymenobacter sp. BT559]
MKILFLISSIWSGGGFAVYHTLPLWAFVVYGLLSLFYLATWLMLRRGFSVR